MPVMSSGMPSGSAPRVKTKFLSKTLTEEVAKGLGLVEFYPAYASNCFLTWYAKSIVLAGSRRHWITFYGLLIPLWARTCCRYTHSHILAVNQIYLGMCVCVFMRACMYTLCVFMHALPSE